MKMDRIAGSGKDEFYTPRYAVDPILKYVPAGAKVLCPFDDERSQFVKVLTAHGCQVEFGHMWTGDDFFQRSDPGGAEYVISNPPYSLKFEVLDRLFSWGTPFAMLVGVVGLFESRKRFDMFSQREFEIMYLSRRISYFENYEDPSPKLNPPFSSVYITSKMLPDRIVFEAVDKSS